MDWRLAIEEERAVLERILALLLSLAGLADRASCLPVSRQLQLLCILGHGEAVARAFVAGTAFAPADEAGDVDVPAADRAAGLAASFRALALILGALLARSGRSAQGRRHDARPRVSHRLPTRLETPSIRLAARAPPRCGHASRRSLFHGNITSRRRRHPAGGCLRSPANGPIRA